MEPLSIREARKRFGELVEAAEHGETVVITRRGRRVARLVSMAETRLPLPDLEAFRATLQAQGPSLSQVVVELREAERC